MHLLNLLRREYLSRFLTGLLLFSVNREFCGMARKVYIYTREEVKRMLPGTLSSKNEENSLVGEGNDDKDAKNLIPSSDSSPEKC